MDKIKVEKQIKIWQEWVDRQSENNKFILSPKKDVVEKLANGVLENEKNSGFKFCPCRMTLGEREEDLKLVCPCNFRSQKTWREKGECWCGLFVKGKI